MQTKGRRVNGTFEQRAKICAQLTERAWLKPAVDAAHTLVQDFPREPQAWYLHNFTVCMSNRQGGPAHVSPLIIKAARQQLGDRFTDELHGDLLRDQGLGLTIFGSKAQLGKIPDLVTIIRRHHASDGNRLAATFDLEGRYYFARGNPKQALRFHAHADQAWREMGNYADPAWVADNKVRWLRACIAEFGSSHMLSFARDISTEFPSTAPQVKLLMTPGIGPRLFSLTLKRR